MAALLDLILDCTEMLDPCNQLSLPPLCGVRWTFWSHDILRLPLLHPLNMSIFSLPPPKKKFLVLLTLSWRLLLGGPGLNNLLYLP